MAFRLGAGAQICKFTCCYAWSHREGREDQGERFVAVLELPPVKDPQSAVKVAIVADAKKQKSL